jgi:uncharacterized protein YkwD
MIKVTSNNRELKKMNRICATFTSIVLALIIGFTSLPLGTGVHAASFSDMNTHWAKTFVEWGVTNEITAGYTDGTFKPNNKITEREFIAMVFRSYPDIQVAAPAVGEAWYAPYYTAAASLNWPVSDMLAKNPYTRGQVARVIAATQLQYLTTNEAIQYLLDTGLSQGKTSATVEGYAGGDTITRAEALTFIYNVKQVEAGHVQEEPVASTAAFSLNGIALGDTEAQVIKKLGAPVRKDITDRKYTWYVYNQDYTQYAQIGIADGAVVALYSNAGGWKSTHGVVPGASKANVAKHAGVTASAIAGETYSYQQNSTSFTVYLDKHKSNQVDAILIAKPNLPAVDQLANASTKASLISAYERQSLDLTNAFRVKNGLAALAWHDLVAKAAREHSADMAANDYFDHTNLSGLQPWDRLTEAGVPAYGAAGENIAAGQRSAIDAHHGWLNSAGHRKNMLSADFTMLGVGVAYESDSEYNWYYTQNFYTPLY